MSAEAAHTEQGAALHGGRLVAKRLKAHGVAKLFTLSGGHLFSIYDGCREEEIDIVDVRHEQSAAFAAEGWAKATREPGVCALTAGPGVTNGMSAIASARMNGSPVLALGGRAPAMRWGMGSLQEIDHVPFVSPIAKLARTADSTAAIPGLVDEALHAALEPPSGPAFVDFPLDQVFMESDVDADAPASLPDPAGLGPPDGDALERAAELLRSASKPVVMAGTGLYWAHAETELRALCDELHVPVFLNGLARGCVPADNPLFFSRARGTGLKGADVALVVGVPMDFRLGFGGSFGDNTRIVVIGSSSPEREHPREVAAELYGSVAGSLDALRSAAAGGPSAERTAWAASLREVENEKRAAEREDLTDARSPLHPMRVYGELAQVLDRDAIVIGDGGDFVSFAGRMIETYEPGCWMDPGPYGCLGAGPGYALAAQVAHPGRQVCLLLGDGAFGFAGMEFDSFVRHGLPIVGVMGNNGIWALEKHPMEFLYGYSVAAELQPECRYDEVVRALGGHGELVRHPDELRPALERAFASGKPALVNVLTDPAVVYPRRANLA
ncbi:MAG TPA: acetolactate synthase [Thermoleophilaceae bacterium]|nr:acetolactate synthase [Thermoleophilaceae bacterium]